MPTAYHAAAGRSDLLGARRVADLRDHPLGRRRTL